MKNQQEMQRLGDYLHRGATAMAKTSMITINREAIPLTPVDTGEARSGGRITSGEPSAFKPPDEAPSYPLYGDNAAMADMAGFQLGNTLWWTNNVPYVIYLDPAAGVVSTGHSPQAPDGWLRQSVQKAKAEVEVMQWNG